MAYKVFVNGQALSASDLNDNLMKQAIAVFADATARDTAITVPVNGQFVYLLDSEALLKYDGSAWVSGVTGLTDLVTDATTARTLTSDDAGKTIRFTSSSATVVTVDGSTDFPIGSRVDIIADGTGELTVAASGATVAGAETSTTSGSFTVGAQYSAATLLCVATDEYRLIGKIEAV